MMIVRLLNSLAIGSSPILYCLSIAPFSPPEGYITPWRRRKSSSSALMASFCALG